MHLVRLHWLHRMPRWECLPSAVSKGVGNTTVTHGRSNQWSEGLRPNHPLVLHDDRCSRLSLTLPLGSHMQTRRQPQPLLPPPQVMQVNACKVLGIVIVVAHHPTDYFCRMRNVVWSNSCRVEAEMHVVANLWWLPRMLKWVFAVPYKQRHGKHHQWPRLCGDRQSMVERVAL